MASLNCNLRASRNGLRGNHFHVRVPMREEADPIDFKLRMLHMNVVHHPNPAENDDEQHKQYGFAAREDRRPGVSRALRGKMVN